MPRIADGILSFKLSTKGAVWIRGPKRAGKSTTAERFANSCRFMLDDDSEEQNILLARISPSAFLEGEPPLLIDEWQTMPFIWNQIRMEVDRRDKFGQFILTGSIQPDSEEMQKLHSGIGRISEMLMRPMTLYESGEQRLRIHREDLARREAVAVRMPGRYPRLCVLHCQRRMARGSPPIGSRRPAVHHELL